MIGKFPEIFELQPIISRTQPVHLQLTAGSLRTLLRVRLQSDLGVRLQREMAVGNAAITTHFAFSCLRCKHVDGAHLQHRMCEVVEELLLVVCVKLHELQAEARSELQHRVREEKPLARLQVLEVLVVEARGRARVKRIRDVSVSVSLRAEAAELPKVCNLDRGSGSWELIRVSLVEQTRLEARAPCLADRVGS